MDVFPTEVLVIIYRSLCFHCAHPEKFPNADIPDTRASKAALAHICRLSKRHQSIAQPILYHYYATGNLIQERKEYLPSDKTYAPREDDKLPHFVRTILQRPDLAVNIRSLQLVNNRICNETFPTDVTSLIVRANKALGIEFPDERGLEGTVADTLEGIFPVNETLNSLIPDGDPYEGIYGRTYPDKVHQWIAELAIVSTTNLETLFVARPYPVWDFLEGGWSVLEQLDTYQRATSRGRLHALRRLGLTGHGENFNLNEWEHLFWAAPNLDTLYAIGCDAWEDGAIMVDIDDFWAVDRTLSLPSLRKLVIECTCLQMEDFTKTVLVNCQQLQHIEYYRNTYPAPQQPRYLTLAQIFGPVKDRLETLVCVKWAPWNKSNEPTNPDPLTITLGSGLPSTIADGVLNDTLQDFTRLRYLSIDCATVFGLSSDGRRLAEFLPVSIRDLRVTYVFKGIAQEIEHLVHEIPRQFPRLQRVSVSVVQRAQSGDIRRHLIDLAGQPRGTTNIQIEVEKEYDLLKPAPRTLLPGVSVGSILPPFPSRKAYFIDGKEIL